MNTKSHAQLQTLGDQIAGWRRQRGLTQSQLESMAGLAHNALSRIENNQVSPRLATIERIAVALGLSIEELQFRKANKAGEQIRDSSAEYLMGRLNALDDGRKAAILTAFHSLLDEIEPR